MESEHRLRVLLDANVLFSGFRDRSGTNGRLLLLAADKYQAVVSREVVDEFVRNLSRKAPFALVAAEEWFDAVEVEVWDDCEPAAVDVWETLGMKEDSHVLAIAVEAEVNLICSGDLKFRERLHDVANVPKATSPRELLDLLTL
jgi:predicted nucleic acid-binding protein